MKPTTTAGVVAMCFGLAACGRADREARDTAENKPTSVTETGCLTARGDQFVLTDLQPTSGVKAETQSFQLVGMDDELRQHVGKTVRVAGVAEGGEVAVVRESTPSPDPNQPAGTSGQAPKPTAVPKSPGQGDAQVSTQTETQFEVRKLRVESVTPTGDSCAAETKSPEGAAKPPVR
jgi:hypothetical protein